VTLGRHGDVGALHVSDTVCAACGFPLIEEDAPVL
jgi:ribosomal protein L37E